MLSGAASYLVVTTDGVYAFDDVQVSAEDLSATTYTYDAANQLTAMNVNGTTTNFTYDDWGRMVGKTQGSYAATYAYRFGDKLKAVTSNFPGETASVGYNYDGLGHRRLEQRDNTTATWFRWSGWEECGEYAGTVGSWTIGALQTGYVPGLATFAGSNPATAEWRYRLTDHLGSVRQLSGQTKAALARYDYAPYGELLRSAGLPLTVGYTGHLWDNAIGQYYAPFRYYNPQTARWNMRDPLGLIGGINQYAYVQGKPTVSTDPRGAIAIWVINVLGNAATAGIVSAMCPGNTVLDILTDAIGGGVGGLFSSLPIPRHLSDRVLQGVMGGFEGSLATTTARLAWKPMAGENVNVPAEGINMAIGMGLSAVSSFLRINPVGSGLAVTAMSGSLSCAIQNWNGHRSPGNILGESQVYDF